MEASGTRPGKVLMVEVGTDEHDRSAQALATTLRNGGLEVVYTGRFATADALARSALEEDVDVIVLCSPCQTALPTTEITAALTQAGWQNIGLVAAGAGVQAPIGFAAVIDANRPDEDTLARMRDVIADCRTKNRGLRQ